MLRDTLSRMSNRSEIRRLAIQILYQLDVRGDQDADAIRELLDPFDPPDRREQGYELAWQAWMNHWEADDLATTLAPQWPTYRQPPVDRAILRLAYFELATQRAPANVVINEAIDLAKRFGSENSPVFVNGVLDQMAARLATQREDPPATDAATDADPAATPIAPQQPAEPQDPWLADALKNARPPKARPPADPPQ